MPALFPQIAEKPELIGIAKLAASGTHLDDGHNVEYIEIQNRSLLARCDSVRVPFEWMINPYRGCEFACKYCYARYTHEFMELRESTDFEQKIYVKQHAPWLLRQELAKVKRGERIAIGSATDPYQPAERRFGVTRGILTELAEHRGLEVGIITKSDMIVRDTDLLWRIAQQNKLTVCLTVTTTRVDLARIMEPRAPRPDLRLKAVTHLVTAGIHAGVNCAPVLPGINDSLVELERTVQAAAEANAKFISANSVFLKPCALKVFMPFLEANFPHLVRSYQQRFDGRAFLPPEYQRRISTLMKKLREKHGITGERVRLSPAEGVPPDPKQMGLFQ